MPQPEESRFLRELMRKMMRDLERLERELEETMREFAEMERLLEEREREAAEGRASPLYTVIDKGKELLLVFDVPEVEEGTLEITLLEDRIIVEGRVDKRKVERALGKASRRVEKIKGEYVLPFTIDPQRAKVEKKGSKVYVRVPKQGY
ncbi:MAG: Hsp20 family protein [Acidilobaceae archaeon]